MVTYLLLMVTVVTPHLSTGFRVRS